MQHHEDTLTAQATAYLQMQYPDVPFKIDILAGMKVTVGQATRAKRLGNTKSWPDLTIAVARQGYHGLFLELKADGVRLVKRNGQPATEHIAEQTEMLQRLKANGYLAEFAVGFDDFKSKVDGYLCE